MLSATDENDDWYEQVFSSAEIEELTYRARIVEETIEVPIKIELYFDEDKAREFIAATRTRSSDNVRELLMFCRYLAEVVRWKMEEAHDGDG